MRALSLAQKIWGVLGLLGIAFVISAVFSTYKLQEEKENVTYIAKTLIKLDQLSAEMDVNQRAMTATVFEIIVDKDDQKMQTLSKKWDVASESFNKSFATYQRLSDKEGQDLAKEYEKEFAVYKAASLKARDLGIQNKFDAARDAIGSIEETRARMRKTMDAMNKLTADKLDQATKEAEKDADDAILFQIIMSAISIVTSGVIAFFVVRQVTNAIQKVVAGLSESSERVTSAAHQIAAASQQLSSASTEQAAALVETASSTEEMNQMVRKNSDNAKATAETSEASSDKAQKGKSVVERMIESMNQISHSNDEVMNQVSQSNQSMLDVVKVIEEIGSKTKIINDIVFQTKLLSFNASVEAARAGEHGKGFAVVAEEIGSLASMSGSAAKEISELLQMSTTRVNDLVRSTQSSVSVKAEEGKAAVTLGAEVAKECGIVLDEIVANVDQTSKMASEISAASEEQSRGVHEITKAMSQLDQMTQQNTATSQECASAASDLSGQAEALKTLVHDLVQAVEGEKGQVHQSPPASEPKATHKVVNFESKKKHAKEQGSSKHQAHSARRVAGSDIPMADDKGFKDI